MSQHSAACCTIPPVQSNYKEKGSYITIDGMKTYHTGPTSSKTAILIIYDIFGFYPQTLQGADILATSDKDKHYQVFMPDLFEGKPADISWYPPDTKEKGEKLGNFFNTAAAPPKTVARVPKIVNDIKSKHGIETFAILGYCWGGKIVNLTSQEGTLFKAAAACHPAMVHPDDAPGVTIPFIMLPSQDEDKNDVEKWEKGLKVKHQVTWFPTQIHGFMAARGNLDDAEVKKEYERGYATVLQFFHDNL